VNPAELVTLSGRSSCLITFSKTQNIFLYSSERAVFKGAAFALTNGAKIVCFQGGELS